MRELPRHVTNNDVQFVTYNGDFFDFPFIDKRMQKYNLVMEEEIGFQKQQSEEYGSRFATHLDAFHWVNRDSYLPQGSRGLKAVTKYKLGYDPKEISPEDMLPFARERPQEMASYSVSDAVATYYLYMQYVHPFIFSLCNIIPMTPDDVLRKGSGTLCETLLQVQAFRGGIVCPNKYRDDPMKMYKGSLLESETYIGGHVEALNSGVFRSDFMYKFNVDPGAMDELIANLDRDLTFAIEVEGGKKMEDIENYAEKKQDIIDQLLALREQPRREENPSIYHLDVAAMYPNIILTNRLQPPAMVTPQTCASCDFYHPEMQCRREMEWKWRGEVFPAQRSEINQIKGQIQADSETFEASPEEIKTRVKTYCNTVYRRTHDTKTELRTAYICQRENSFYIDTVKSFRDRRYEYKGLTKQWNGKLRDAEKANDPGAVKDAKNFVVLYDSLQLAHKCILNSFYGYVMRRGARWFSMEMAGVVTHKGGEIIRVARKLVERIGIPLELDTDGIWCCLPQSFPDGIEFKIKGEKKPFVVSYPCSMLNAQTHHDCVNPQYHTLVNEEKQEYKVHSECSILFELDGPYKAMILPASQEEGKMLKKRYAVFNFDGSLAELKGFELKRRGELNLVKVFQERVFKRFLDGGNLEECYSSVADVANHWLDVLDNRGVDLEDDDLLDLISESANMSKTMEEYEGRKSMAITTAKRIAEFLGADMIANKGLNCTYIVSRTPEGAPVTERAIPVEIFKAEKDTQEALLRKWCAQSSLVDTGVDVRSILDWQYYKDRLGKAIQKIVTIPAAMQLVKNPVDRVPHPDWLLKKVRERLDPLKQNKMTNFFEATDKPLDLAMELEGTMTRGEPSAATVVKHKGAGRKGRMVAEEATVKPLPELEAGTRVVKLGRDVDAEGTTMYTDFEGWHAYMRTLWHNQSIERKRRRLEDADGDSSMRKLRRTAGAAGGLSTFYQTVHYSMLNRHWDVLQICETSTPGLFNVWAVLDDRSMQKIKLEVPRIFYVNTRLRDGQAPTSKGLSRKLPFGKTCYNLEEVRMPEEKYQEHAKEIAAQHEDPAVEGLYETQVPLLFRAVLDIGCVAKVVNRPGGFRERVVKRRERPDTVALEDLRSENTTQCPYLPRSRGELRKAYLYHSFSESDGGARGFVALMAPMEAKRCHVWIVSRNANGQRPPLARYYKDACSEQAAAAEDSAERDALLARGEAGCEFEVDTASTLAEAWFGVVEVLRRFQEENAAAPTVLLKHSTRTTAELQREMPILHDFPVMEVFANEQDNQYEPLGWEAKAGHSLVESLLGLDGFFEHMMQLARYSHIPLCNIHTQGGPSMHTFVSDVFYGRALQANNYVLWASPGQRPDTGGDDSLMAFECDEMKNPDANFPSASRHYCVSLDVINLPLSAVVFAKELDEENAGGAGGGDDASDAISRQVASGTIPLAAQLTDESTFCVEPFKIVNLMALSWIGEASKYGNKLADQLQMNLYHWLNNVDSLFFAPGIARYVHRLTRKLYGLLIAKLRSLGAEIIHASFQQVMLNTKKTQGGQAWGYCDFLQESLGDVPSFKHIVLSPRHVWARLVYMDRYNYAGLEELPLGSRELEDERNIQRALRPAHDMLDDGLVLRSQWDIAEHLPRRFRKLAYDLIADFVCLPMKFRREGAQGATPARGDAAGLTSPGLTQKRKALASAVQGEIQFTKELFTAGGGREEGGAGSDVAPHFSKRLFEEIRKDSGQVLEFPSRPGSHLDMRDPHLEVLKQVCFVFGLDPELKAEVDVMKRGLLRLLQVLAPPPPPPLLTSSPAQLRPPCARSPSGQAPTRGGTLGRRCGSFRSRRSSRTRRGRWCCVTSSATRRCAPRRATWTCRASGTLWRATCVARCVRRRTTASTSRSGWCSTR